jgi:hypothetical protein
MTGVLGALLGSSSGAGGGGGGGGGVVFDAKSQATPWNGVGAGAQTWTHTPVGTPSGIILCLVNFDGSNSPNPSAVSYGGVSMGSAAVAQTVFGISGDLAIYGLANPPSGAKTVSITLPGTNNFGFASVISVTGSDLTTIFDFNNTATNTGTSSISCTTTTANTDLVIDVVAANTSSDTLSSPGSGQTGTMFTGRTDLAFSYKSASGSSQAMTWALSPSDQWWSNVVSVKHA